VFRVAVIVNCGLRMSRGCVAKQVAHAVLGLYRTIEISKNPALIDEFGFWQELG
jgi:peptidyl-tRNA hydrolase